jgi:hypothetical protein
MREIQLPRGVTIRTFRTPPPGFDPLNADDRELTVFGFPRRPTENPRLLARWERVLSRPIRAIQPTFRHVDYKRRRLPNKVSRAVHGTETTDIWSGAVVHAPAGDSFQWVEGTWTVPDAFPPGGAQDGVWYSASTWVGIDGIDGSGDVLQAGCDSDVMTQSGTIQRQLNPWWEWFPAGSYWISNLPIVQGDTVNCLICVTAGSTTSAAIFLYNVTSGIGASFQATAPSGTSLVGNSAEWVVERLEIDTNTPELARYGDVYFDEANAGTVGGATLQGGSGNVIEMVDSNNNVISTGALETGTLVQVKYTGP